MRGGPGRAAARAKRLPARGARYLKEDAKKVRRAMTGPRVSHALVIGGATTIVASVAQWQGVVAGVLAGVFTIVYGLVLVDVDASEETPSVRWRAKR